MNWRRCPHCRELIEVTEDGLLVRHRQTPVQWCAGSGQQPEGAGR